MRLSEESTQVRYRPWCPGQDMAGTYEVEWLSQFKSLTWFMSVVIISGSIVTMALRLVTQKFDMAKTFQHVSPLMFVLLLLGMPFFCAFFAFLIAMWMRMARITIADGTIQGVNYWGRRKKIPLGSITKLTPFSNNGIHATIVHGRHHGQVFISNHTRDGLMLLDFLNAIIEENKQLLGDTEGKS